MRNPVREPRHLSDYDGKVYDQLATSQVLRRSPKMRGKDRRLARLMARMMGAPALPPAQLTPIEENDGR